MVVLGDWGSTRLRLWLRRDGATLATAEAPGVLVGRQTPEQTLRGALDRLGALARGCPVVLCGMAGARGGLAEAAYIPCPGGREAWIGAATRLSLDDLAVTILPGFSHRDERGHPDVMRGEEAQVFGALERHEADDARADIVLPGTHSKWVRVEHGRITRFATCPTGELYARLLGSSLGPSAPGSGTRGRGEGFTAGLDRTGEGSPLLASLFEARAGRLLDGRSELWSAGYLSGLLIGSEIAAMTRSLTGATAPLVIGSADLVPLYRAAFARFGVDCRTADGELCVLAGMEMAHAQSG
jgi:2-dehydro-3-deoxygalactonokinase